MLLKGHLEHRGRRHNDARDLIWQIYMFVGITTYSKSTYEFFEGYAPQGHLSNQGGYHNK